MKIQHLKTPIRQAIIVKMSDSQKIKSYAERHDGREISTTNTLLALSYLLMKQPYNPILWSLYSLCSFLYGYKPASFKQREIRICDYYVQKEHWLSGNFADIRDILAIDNVTTECPNTAIATLYAPDMQQYLTDDACLIDSKTLYIIPVEWLSYIAVREHVFVLLPFKFCCREVLLRT